MEAVNYAEHKPQSSGGLFLKLSEKGQTLRIRILTGMYPIEQTYNDPQKGEVQRQGYICLAADVTEAAEKKAPGIAAIGLFRAGVQVYKAIASLATDNDWGDPTGYDIKITRTEEKGSYYSVKPSPKAVLHKETKARIDEFLSEHETTIEKVVPALWTKITKGGSGSSAQSGGAGSEEIPEEYNPFEDE